MVTLKKTKQNFAGMKSYALLKAFIKNHEVEVKYKISPVKLIADTNNEFNQVPDNRV